MDVYGVWGYGAGGRCVGESHVFTIGNANPLYSVRKHQRPSASVAAIAQRLFEIIVSAEIISGSNGHFHVIPLVTRSLLSILGFRSSDCGSTVWIRRKEFIGFDK